MSLNAAGALPDALASCSTRSARCAASWTAKATGHAAQWRPTAAVHRREATSAAERPAREVQGEGLSACSWPPTRRGPWTASASSPTTPWSWTPAPRARTACSSFNMVMTEAGRHHQKCAGIAILSDDQAAWEKKVEARPRVAVMVCPVNVEAAAAQASRVAWATSGVSRAFCHFAKRVCSGKNALTAQFRWERCLQQAGDDFAGLFGNGTCADGCPMQLPGWHLAKWRMVGGTWCKCRYHQRRFPQSQIYQQSHPTCRLAGK